MTDLDAQLRELADELRTDHQLDGPEIRRLGTRRRARRQVAMVAAAAAVTVVAAASGATLWRAPDAGPPAGSASNSTIGAVPVWAERLADDPQVFRHAPGGSGLAPVDATVEGRLVVAGGCLVLSAPSTAEETPMRPRVLVLPAGSSWQPSVEGGEIFLSPGRDRPFPMGSDITAAVGLSSRTDDAFSTLCPGTEGYAALTTPDNAVLGPLPGSASRAQPPLDSIPLAEGLAETKGARLDPPSRDLVGQVSEGLGECLNLGKSHARTGTTDAIATVLTGPAGGVSRTARLYADDLTAQTTLAAWRSAAESCDGFVTTDERRLRLSTTVEAYRSPDQVLVFQTAEDAATGVPARGGGHFAAMRIGRVVVTLSSSATALATEDTVAVWRTGDRETLAMLAKKMCQFTTQGCD